VVIEELVCIGHDSKKLPSDSPLPEGYLTKQFHKSRMQPFIYFMYEAAYHGIDNFAILPWCFIAIIFNISLVTLINLIDCL